MFEKIVTETTLTIVKIAKRLPMPLKAKMTSGIFIIKYTIEKIKL